MVHISEIQQLREFLETFFRKISVPLVPVFKFRKVWLNASSETQGQSVGSGEKAGRKFSLRAKEPLGTDSHRTISKNSNGCRLLIGHKKCFVLLCPIGEHISMCSFCVFLHDGYCLDHALSSRQRNARGQKTFSLI